MKATREWWGYSYDSDHRGEFLILSVPHNSDSWIGTKGKHKYLPHNWEFCPVKGLQ